MFSSTATLIFSKVHKKTSPAKGLLRSCQDRGEAQYFISALDSILALLFEHSSVVFQNLSAEPPWIHQCFFGPFCWSPRGCQWLLLDVGAFGSMRQLMIKIAHYEFWMKSWNHLKAPLDSRNWISWRLDLVVTVVNASWSLTGFLCLHRETWTWKCLPEFLRSFTLKPLYKAVLHQTQ